MNEGENIGKNDKNVIKIFAWCLSPSNASNKII
jgi:hypothetical protein